MKVFVFFLWLHNWQGGAWTLDNIWHEMLVCYLFSGSFPCLTVWNSSCSKYFLSHQFRTVTSVHKKSAQSLHCLSREFASEQMRSNLTAWLYGIPSLQWTRCHELASKCWRLSVGLIYKLVSITPSVKKYGDI